MKKFLYTLLVGISIGAIGWAFVDTAAETFAQPAKEGKYGKSTAVVAVADAPAWWEEWLR